MNPAQLLLNQMMNSPQVQNNPMAKNAMQSKNCFLILRLLFLSAIR